MFKAKGQRSRSQRKVMYQQQKRYNTAMDSFSGFKLGMAS